MRLTQGIQLANNVIAPVTPAFQAYEGGRSVLVTKATAYGTTINLEMQDAAGNVYNVNAATISANGWVSYDIPKGMYRLNITGGTTTALYAWLLPVPYA